MSILKILIIVTNISIYVIDVLHSIIKNRYKSGEMVAAICYDVVGLLNVQLFDGDYLIKDKTFTGFNWFEESLAKRKKETSFNLEGALKESGVNYKKAFIPMISKEVVDGSRQPYAPADKRLISNFEINTIKMDTTKTDQTVIDLAGQQVPVVKGGLYDRFRSNPPLSIIAKEAPEIDLNWFKTIEKEKKDVGFITYSPNFYYSNSSITAIYTADMKRLKELIPQEVRDVVKPISITPGRGLIAITAYAYHYCDNDSYNELSISIVTTKPDSGNWGIFSLMGELKNKDLWGYVLKLPVDTELARVRGVVGYNLPKWRIPIDYVDRGDMLTFNFYDESGNLDFSMGGRKLDIEDNEPEIVRSNFINLDAKGRMTHGYTDVHALKKASSKKKEDLQLKLIDGPLSQFMKSLDLGKLIRYDYQPEFQAALYTPELVDEEKK